MEAALKGAGEIGFTIVSITLSLIAVFIPLFLMGGYVGLLFREFAVTVSVALVLSLVIALTLTPMMCSRLLRPEDPAKHGRLYRLLEAGFDGLLGGYERSLKVALRHRFVTLMVMLGTIGATGYLYVIIPKGFFPQQDTGMIIAIAEAAQSILPGDGRSHGGGDRRYPEGPGGGFGRFADRRYRDDDTQRRPPVHRPETEGRTGGERRPGDWPIAAAAGQAAGRHRLHAGGAGHHDRRSRVSDAVPIHAGRCGCRRAQPLGADLPRQAERGCGGCPTSASDQANAGPLLDIAVNRDAASRYGILPATIDNTLGDAFGQRIVSTMFTSLNQYHVVLEVQPQFQTGPQALSKLYVNSPTGEQVPISALVDNVTKVAPIIVNHQGQFPSVTLSFNLMPGVSIGNAVTAIHQIEQQLGKPASLATSFQGNAQAFISSLSSEPILVAAALVVIYIILACSMRASFTRSRSFRRCPRPASARC